MEWRADIPSSMDPRGLISANNANDPKVVYHAAPSTIAVSTSEAAGQQQQQQQSGGMNRQIEDGLHQHAAAGGLPMAAAAVSAQSYERDSVARNREGLDSFTPLRTMRACDICKLRKVKCDGTEPCNTCRMHQSTCLYSGATRRQLLAMVATPGPSNGIKLLSVGPSERRGSFSDVGVPDESTANSQARRPIIYDESALGERSSGLDLHYEQAKRLKRTHSESFGSQVYPARPGISSASSAIDDRTATTGGSLGTASHIIPLRTSEGASGYSSTYISPRTGGEESLSSEGPFSAHSQPPHQGSSSNTRNTDHGVLPHHVSSAPPVFHPLPAEASFPSASTAPLNQFTPRSSMSTSDHHAITHPLDPQGPTLKVYRDDIDHFGIAGLTVFRNGLNLENMRYWGGTSYLALQDSVARVLACKMSKLPASYELLPFKVDRGQPPVMQDVSLWRWRADRYITHKKLRTSVPEDALDPLFLTPSLALRFFKAYKNVIHPLFPILSMDAVSASIEKATSLGMIDPPGLTMATSSSPHQRPSVDRLSFGPAFSSREIARARDLLVLAFGAQIVGGDGDAECHRDIARAWSDVLRRRAKEIMTQIGDGAGGPELVNLWTIHAALSRSYGNSDEELASISVAARLAEAIGLTSQGLYRLPAADEGGFRQTLIVCFQMEQWTGACHGISSTLKRTAEFDVIISGLKEKRAYLLSLVELAALFEETREMYGELKRSSVHAGSLKVMAIYERLVNVRDQMPPEYRNMEYATPLPPHTDRDDGHKDGVNGGKTNSHSGPDMDTSGIDLSTDKGQALLNKFTLCGVYLQVKMMALLPLFQLTVWAAVRDSGGQPQQQPQPLANLPDHVVELGEECVDAAKTLVFAFEQYSFLLFDLTELSLSSILLLYSISVIYLDVLKLSREQGSRKHGPTIVSAYDILDRYEHPAAKVAQAMCHDLMTNHIDAPRQKSR